MRIMPEDLKYRNKALIIMCAILLILHIMYIPFMVLHGHIDGDIAFADITPLLGFTLVIISLLLKYILYGYLLTVYDNYTTRQALPFTVAAVISLLITRIGEIIIFSATSLALAEGEAESFIYTTLAGFAIDIAVIAILFILTKSSQPKKLSRFIWLAAIICLLPLITDIFNEFLTFRVITKELNASGMIMTSEEIMSAVWGFAQHFLKALFGFVILFSVNRALTVSKKKGKPVAKK